MLSPSKRQPDGWFRQAKLVCGARAMQVLMLSWMACQRYRVHELGDRVDPVNATDLPPSVYLVWHEYLPSIYYLRPGSYISVLLSQHRDAELLARAARHNGYGVIRGSSRRGGTAALKQIIQGGSNSSLGLTPDGPRGPRRELKMGCVYLSSRLEMPIIPVGVGYRKTWRVRKSWDQFAIPKPFSRTRLVFGERIVTAKDLDKQGLQDHLQLVSQRMDEVNQMADEWANGEIDFESEPNSRRRAAHQSGNQ